VNDVVFVGDTSRADYHRLEARLCEAGNAQPMNGPICRWHIAGVTVDLMPINADVLGFTNRWYGAMMEHAITMELNDGRHARIVSAPYVTATKLEAFSDRGGGDVQSSHDLGDIIALVDGRPEPADEVRSTEIAARTL